MIGENKPGPSRKAPVPWDSNDIPESPGGPGRGRRCRARARRTPSRSLVHAAAWGARPDTHAAGWPCPPAERDRRGRTKRPALPLRDGGAREKAPPEETPPPFLAYGSLPLISPRARGILRFLRQAELRNGGLWTSEPKQEQRFPHPRHHPGPEQRAECLLQLFHSLMNLLSSTVPESVIEAGHNSSIFLKSAFNL